MKPIKNYYYAYYNSPIGLMQLTATNEALLNLSFVKQQNHMTTNLPLLNHAITQLDEYFQQKLTKFDLPLAFFGTTFQQKVWTFLLSIPYGTTISYQQLATNIGNPKAARAVGSAISKNPLAIIVPCHRVVNANSKIINYFWGKTRKTFILSLEQK